MISNLTLILFLIGCVGFIISLIFLIINIIRKNGNKKLGLKLVSGFAGLAVISVLIQGFTNNTYSNSENSMQTNNNVIQNDESKKEENTISHEEKKDNENRVDEIKKRENIIGTSDKNFINLSDSKPSSVRNDKTGNWKISTVATTDDILEYINSYYKVNFSNNKEIHGIVNFTLNTTTKISQLFDNVVAVTIHEYVDKEEHDANKLFSGMVLGEYWIYLDNGDIEKIK